MLILLIFTITIISLDTDGKIARLFLLNALAAQLLNLLWSHVPITSYWHPI